VEHQDWLEQAELFALGVLDGAELEKFSAHLEPGCALCEAQRDDARRAFNQLARDIEPVAPSADVKSRLLERIDSADKPGLIFIHAGQGDWPEVEPGIFVKVLNQDTVNKKITALVRMAPGARYEDHRHTATEELLVLEGSCYSGGRLLRKGDYHRAEPGTEHFDTRTEEGSLMLLIFPMQNAPLT
jgi:quercetin dioxygenase-like cupin family protein